MDSPASNDFTRSHEEKIRALILDHDLPVAVDCLQTLERHIGEWKPIDGFTPHQAVRLHRIHNAVFGAYFDVTSHIWVAPQLRKYRQAWIAAGMKPLPRKGRQLDHLHARKWASIQGYGYVVLVDVSSGPNMSAGSMERQAALTALPGVASHQPVMYANEIHWAKMWDLNQVRPGQLTNESLGERKVQ